MRNLRVWSVPKGQFLTYDKTDCQFYHLGTPYNLSEILSQPEKFIVEEGTGAVDTHDVEMFVGDIVSFTYMRSPDERGQGIIGVDDMYSGFSLQETNAFFGSGLLRIGCKDREHPNEMEVIGNVHENAGLLNPPSVHSAEYKNRVSKPNL